MPRIFIVRLQKSHFFYSFLLKIPQKHNLCVNFIIFIISVIINNPSSVFVPSLEIPLSSLIFSSPYSQNITFYDIFALITPKMQYLRGSFTNFTDDIPYQWLSKCTCVRFLASTLMPKIYIVRSQKSYFFYSFLLKTPQKHIPWVNFKIFVISAIISNPWSVFVPSLEIPLSSLDFLLPYSQKIMFYDIFCLKCPKNSL